MATPEALSSITCPICRMTSYHPRDVEYRYCGNCHAFTGLPDGYVRAYLRHIGETPSIERVADLLREWFEQRKTGDEISDWLPGYLGQ